MCTHKFVADPIVRGDLTTQRSPDKVTSSQLRLTKYNRLE